MNAGEYMDRAREMVERDRKARRDVMSDDEFARMTRETIEENREALDRLEAHDRGEPYQPHPRPR